MKESGIHMRKISIQIIANMEFGMKESGIHMRKINHIVSRRIKMSLSRTINTGNFESIKVSAEEEIEINPEQSRETLAKLRMELWEQVNRDIENQILSLNKEE